MSEYSTRKTLEALNIAVLGELLASVSACDAIKTILSESSVSAERHFILPCLRSLLRANGKRPFNAENRYHQIKAVLARLRLVRRPTGGVGDKDVGRWQFTVVGDWTPRPGVISGRKCGCHGGMAKLIQDEFLPFRTKA
jgi:hypothetical protein